MCPLLRIQTASVSAVHQPPGTASSALFPKTPQALRAAQGALPGGLQVPAICQVWLRRSTQTVPAGGELQAWREKGKRWRQHALRTAEPHLGPATACRVCPIVDERAQGASPAVDSETEKLEQNLPHWPRTRSPQAPETTSRRETWPCSRAPLPFGICLEGSLQSVSQRLLGTQNVISGTQTPPPRRTCSKLGGARAKRLPALVSARLEPVMEEARGSLQVKPALLTASLPLLPWRLPDLSSVHLQAVTEKPPPSKLQRLKLREVVRGALGFHQIRAPQYLQLQRKTRLPMGLSPVLPWQAQVCQHRPLA